MGLHVSGSVRHFLKPEHKTSTKTDLPGSVWVTPSCSDQRFCMSRGRQAVSCLRRSAAAPACTDEGKRARRRDHECGGSKGLALDKSLKTSVVSHK